MSEGDTIERILKNPFRWIVGGVTSAVVVLASIGVDPISSTAALLSVLYSNATGLFTAASIAGFTVAPEVPYLPEGMLQGAALLFGVVVILSILGQIWDSIKDRLTD